MGLSAACTESFVGTVTRWRSLSSPGKVQRHPSPGSHSCEATVHWRREAAVQRTAQEELEFECSTPSHSRWSGSDCDLHGQPNRFVTLTHCEVPLTVLSMCFILFDTNDSPGLDHCHYLLQMGKPSHAPGLQRSQDSNPCPDPLLCAAGSSPLLLTCPVSVPSRLP